MSFELFALQRMNPSVIAGLTRNPVKQGYNNKIAGQARNDER